MVETVGTVESRGTVGMVGTVPATSANPGGVADWRELVTSHLSLVSQVVRQATARFPSYVDRDDLRGAGCLGLVDAARRYDPTTGVPFDRYATIRIRGSVLDATRARDWAPRRLRRELRAIDDATSALEHRLGRRPSDAEVAEVLGIAPETVHARRSAEVDAVMLAIDGPDPETPGDRTPLADRFEERDRSWLPEPAFERAELSATVRNALRHLPDRLHHVLVEHYYEGRLLRDVAAELGCTEARVSQLGIEALHALRAYLGTVYTGVAEVPATAPGRQQRARFVASATAAARREPEADRTRIQCVPVTPARSHGAPESTGPGDDSAP